MHAYLFIGATESERTKNLESALAKLGIASWAQRILEKEEESASIGIGALKKWISYLSVSDQKNQNAGIIPHAEFLTVDAQNSLLKTLEEPPKHTLIFLCAPNQDALIETIRSRCQIIRCRLTEEESAVTPIPNELTDLSLPIGQWFNYIDRTIKSREDAIVWVDSMLQTWRQTVRSKKNTSSNTLGKYLLEARQILVGNGNYKLTIDRIRIRMLLSGHSEIR